MVLCYIVTLTHLVHMKGCTCQVLGILLEGPLPPAGKRKPVLHHGWQSPSNKTNSKDLLEPTLSPPCLWEPSNLNCYFQSYHESLAVCNISPPDWVERFLSSISIFVLHHCTASWSVYSKTYHLHVGRSEWGRKEGGGREGREGGGEGEREEGREGEKRKKRVIL